MTETQKAQQRISLAEIDALVIKHQDKPGDEVVEEMVGGVLTPIFLNWLRYAKDFADKSRGYC